MAVNTKISNAAAIAACDAIVDKIDVGAGTAYLRIYDGTQPANPDVAVSTQTLLAEMALPNPAFGAAADGTDKATATADCDPDLSDATANASGTASWFRVINRNGDAVIDGSVGTSSADLILNSVAISAGATVTITDWTFSVNE